MSALTSRLTPRDLATMREHRETARATAPAVFVRPDGTGERADRVRAALASVQPDLLALGASAVTVDLRDDAA